MIYLSGAINRQIIGRRKDVGIMLGYRVRGITGGARQFFDRVLWAADNGCFTNPDLDVGKFLAWLKTLKKWQSTCLFATAPDVVGSANETWERSRDVLPRIRTLGYPVAFVAQDGIENEAIHWDAFDVLFIGGSTEWKLSASVHWLCREALNQGKWVHMGRVNSFRRILRARFAGCHSVDGTALAFAPDERLEELERWLNFIDRQPVLINL